MFTEQEKEFMDAVAKVYCAPIDGRCLNRTMTVADAIYYAARDRGEMPPAGDAEREAFFKKFMGGLIHRAEAQEYIRDAIAAITTQQKQQRNEAANRRATARDAALEQMEIILKAAQEIQRLTTGIGVVPVFAKYSAELDHLKQAKERISHIR